MNTIKVDDMDIFMHVAGCAGCFIGIVVTSWEFISMGLVLIFVSDAMLYLNRRKENAANE